MTDMNLCMWVWQTHAFYQFVFVCLIIHVCVYVWMHIFLTLCDSDFPACCSPDAHTQLILKFIYKYLSIYLSIYIHIYIAIDVDRYRYMGASKSLAVAHNAVIISAFSVLSVIISTSVWAPADHFQHTAGQYSIKQAPIFGWILFCYNWIIAVREGFSSDYTDYSLQCSDGQRGLKSIIWLLSHRKSFLAHKQMRCLPAFGKNRPKEADVSSQVEEDQTRQSITLKKRSTFDLDYFGWIQSIKIATIFDWLWTTPF